jgi:hypothetical protein
LSGATLARLTGSWLCARAHRDTASGGDTASAVRYNKSPIRSVACDVRENGVQNRAAQLARRENEKTRKETKTTFENMAYLKHDTYA